GTRRVRVRMARARGEHRTDAVRMPGGCPQLLHRPNRRRSAKAARRGCRRPVATSNFMAAFTRTPIGGRNRRPRGTPDRPPRLGSDAGFTLIEVLIAAVVLAVGLIGLLGLLDTSVKATASTRAREGAVSLARQVLEDAHTIPFAQMSPTSVVSELQAMKGLENATPGPTWHIARRASATQKPITYTVTAEECSVDGPKDGLAKEHDSTYCPGQPNWKAGEA